MKACFSKLTKLPTAAEIAACQANDQCRKRARSLMAQLRKSELAKSRCGKQLLQFYSNR